MHNELAVLGGIVALLSSIPYILNTLHGKTHPNLVSWSTWMLLHVIATVAAIESGAMQTAIFTAAAALSTGAITLMGLKNGYWRYTRLDIFCQVLALSGIMAWLVTDKPLYAMIIVMLVNLMAAVPTFRHSWRAPRHETWQTFALSVLASGIVLASIEHYNFTSLAYPVYFFVCDGALTLIILARRSSFQPALAISDK